MNIDCILIELAAQHKVFHLDEAICYLAISLVDFLLISGENKRSSTKL